MRIQLGNPKQYYTQLNNQLKPLEACNVTSLVMALDIAGYTLPTGDYPQAEDNLMAILTSKGAQNVLRAKDPQGYFKNYAPNEVFFMHSWAVNEVLFPVEKPLIYRENWTWLQIIDGLKAGNPFVAGTFLTSYGHIVTVTGVELDESGNPVKVIVNDPYGNYFQNYKSGSGFGVEFPFDLWEKLHRFGPNSKLGHMIRKAV